MEHYCKIIVEISSPELLKQNLVKAELHMAKIIFLDSVVVLSYHTSNSSTYLYTNI